MYQNGENIKAYISHFSDKTMKLEKRVDLKGVYIYIHLIRIFQNSKPKSEQINGVVAQWSSW